MRFEVDVLRISTKELKIVVTANSQDEANAKALDVAGNHGFNTDGHEINATYELA